MEDTIQLAGPVQTQTRRSWRAISVLAAVALVLGGVVLARGSDPATYDRSEVVTNIDDGTAVVDGVGATLGRALEFGQAPPINVGALICAIITPILATLSSVFGGFLSGIFAGILARFGCAS